MNYTSNMLESELILNKDGSIYHLHLLPEHIADTVILVGDQGRVKQISKYFDVIEHRIQNREFITHTGYFNNVRITVISSGIGTDNIDIVMNELDAVVNIDLKARQPKEHRKSLRIIRIGTSAGLQEDIHVGSYVVSEYGLGFDGLVYYYDYGFNNEELDLVNAIRHHLAWDEDLAKPYITKGSEELVHFLGSKMIRGITATASGFYGPQGRSLHLHSKFDNMTDLLQSFLYEKHRITNFEMETSAIYSLGKMLGHRCCTCCAIIANRKLGEKSENQQLIVDELIRTVLDAIVKMDDKS